MNSNSLGAIQSHEFNTVHPSFELAELGKIFKMVAMKDQESNMVLVSVGLEQKFLEYFPLFKSLLMVFRKFKINLIVNASEKRVLCEFPEENQVLFNNKMTHIRKIILDEFGFKNSLKKILELENKQKKQIKFLYDTLKTN